MRPIDLDGPAPHFIGAWDLEAPKLCQSVIAFFEASPSLWRQGRGSGGDPSVKKSTDITIQPGDLTQPAFAPVAAYVRALYGCYQDYLQQWPFLAVVLPVADIGSFNIQKYDPGGHFAALHCERSAIGRGHRVLAWMTYLNEVEDGGRTSFPHYGLDIRPEQGKTLIWPVDWTHAHCGQVVNSGTKYIITGWMHFPPPDATTRPRY